MPRWSDGLQPYPERDRHWSSIAGILPFDLLHINGENLTSLPLLERKARLASLLNGAATAPIQRFGHRGAPQATICWFTTS
jgi:ATP-dependent DNA ligase